MRRKARSGHCATVSSVTQMRVPKYLFTPSVRAAVLTVSPSAVKSIREVEPKLPTVASPVWMPIRVTPIGTPAAFWRRRNASA